MSQVLWTYNVNQSFLTLIINDLILIYVDMDLTEAHSMFNLTLISLE